MPRSPRLLAATALTVAVGAAATVPAVAAEPDSYYPSKGDGRIDVRAYDLDLRWQPRDKVLAGTATLRLRAVEPADSFTLDLHSALKVSAATLDGVPVETTRDGHDLIVPALLVPGAAHELQVTYAGRPRTVAAPTSRVDSTGLGWHTTTKGQVWTMQKPFGAFTWHPVNDHPSDKARYTIRLDVPDEWVGVASGKLLERVTADRRTRTRFEHTDPVAPYLTTVAIGPYKKVSATGPHDLPLTFWIPKGRDELLKPLRKTGEAITWLEKRLGPYPFDRAGVVVTPGRGSVETQTLVTLSRDEYRYGNADVREQVAHHLAHHWYGGTVSPDDWRDNWMGESMATYLQAQFAISRGWDTRAYWDAELERNDQYWRDLFGPPGAYDRQEFGQRNVHYGGALILKRLRTKIGSTAFGEAMHRWPQENLHTSRGRSAYISFLESVSGQVLTPWFNDWLTSDQTPSS
ncbi:MAG: M1 family metallopeptidase [Actinomycetes bacterium]